MVLHADSRQLVHRQPGRLPHRGADDHANSERRGPGDAVEDRLRDAGGGQHNDLLSGFAARDLPEDVALHGESAVGLCEGLR